MQRKGQRKVLGSSLVQPISKTPSAIQQAVPRRFSISPGVSTENGISDFDFSDDISSTSSIERSVLDGGLAGVEGQKRFFAPILLDIWRKLGPSATDAGGKALMEQYANQETYHIDSTISSRYANLCNLKDSGCTYSSQSTCPHIHVPTSKCTITASTSEPSSPPHEHCISRLRPFPGQAGPCLLADKVDRKHICCYWADEDRIDWPQSIEEEYDRGKISEANRLHTRIYDRSRWINRKEQFLPYAPHTLKEFCSNEGGRLLLSDLESVVCDEGLCNVKESRSGSGENAMSLDHFLAEQSRIKQCS